MNGFTAVNPLFRIYKVVIHRDKNFSICDFSDAYLRLQIGFEKCFV